ncbi:hypothetical protein AVEN_83008-1 [Araneus ventricosus]|uniref:Myb/SANT-like DNA-binding domain-containing protein n=1 Tax=Araneus ventricosus TaxID=182803 RepID=A0A4Y2GKM9_ARAVE|nr:hypothetical protein AVEN_83008-1 [Araneus ventricosus]
MSEVLHKPRVCWGDDEVRVFLKSWKNHLYINRLIKKGFSKHPLYYAISKDLKKCGFNRSVKEIEFKKKNMERMYRRTEGPKDFRYYNEMDEIFKMDQGIMTEDNTTAEPQIVHATEQPQIVLDGSYVEGISSKNVQVIRLAVPDHQDVSDSSPSSYTVISHSGPEVQNGIEVIEATHLPQSSSSNSQETPENILLSFYQEFERSNRQLEKNDAAMLELFKEQNDIFRTQTTLLMKLLLK